MSSYQFSYGHYVAYQGSVWEIESLDPKTKILKLSRTTDALKISIPYSEALGHLVNNQLKFIDPETATKPLITAEQRALADFSTKSSEQKKEAVRRSKYLNILKELKVPSFTKKYLDPLIANIALQIGDPTPPSAITVYRWHKNYKNASEDIRSLIKNEQKKGNRSKRLDPEVQQIIDTTIKDVYLKGHKPSITTVYEELKRNIWKENKFRIPSEALTAPSLTTLINKIKALDPVLVTLHREGKHAAEMEFRVYQTGVSTTRPLERVEIDHTQLDLFVIDDQTGFPLGKPYITAAIDHHTGSVTGFYISFTPPSAFSVMECLKVAILPKVEINKIFPSIKNTWDVFGVFETLIVDNGKEFYSIALEEACIQLGINIQYAPPLHPWFKASIERYFSIINQKLLNGMEGKSLKDLGKFADYDPIKNAVIDFSSFVEIMYIWVIDIFHQTFKERIGDTPAEKWRKSVLIYPPLLPKSALDVNITLGLHDKRKIVRTGISYEGLIYNSSELALLRQKILDNPNVTIKIDPSNISHIFVLDPIKEEYFSVPAINQKYATGKTLFQHQVIRRNAREYAKSSVNMNNLMEAADRIEEVVEKSKHTSKNRKTQLSQKVARYEDISQNSVLSSKSNEQLNSIYKEKNRSPENLVAEVEKKIDPVSSDKIPLTSFYDEADDWSSDYSLGGINNE
ncbi:Mu transposase C-terminal domain-containing protein [Acinetobacter sp. AGC35]